MVGASYYLSYPDNVLLASNRIGHSYKYQDETPVIRVCIYPLQLYLNRISRSLLKKHNPEPTMTQEVDII